MCEAKRLGQKLIEEGWPKSKEEAAKVKADVENAASKVEFERRFKLIASLGNRVCLLATGSRIHTANDKTRMAEITELARKIGELSR
jgi:polyhydroxyalkanoate synthesis regulator phasin